MSVIVEQVKFISVEMDVEKTEMAEFVSKSEDDQMNEAEAVEDFKNNMKEQKGQSSSGLFSSVLLNGKKSYDWTKAKAEQSILSPLCRPCFRFIDNLVLPVALRFGPTDSLKKIIVVADTRLDNYRAKIQPRLNELFDRILATLGVQLIYRSQEEIRVLKENNKLLQDYYDQRGVKIAFLENYNLEMLKDKQIGFELRDEQIGSLLAQNTELQTSAHALLQIKTQLENELEIVKDKYRQLDAINKHYEASMRSAEEELMEVKQDDMQLRRNSIVLSELHEKEVEELKEKHRHEIESLNRELRLATDEIKATEEKAEQLTGTVVELLAQREIKENSYGSPNKSFKIKRKSKRDSASK